MAPMMAERAPMGMDGLLKGPTRKRLQDDRWEFPNSESRSEDSYDESAEGLVDGQVDGPSELGIGEEMDRAAARPLTLDEYERALHPLQDVADRVGREAERFAEHLERLNPMRESDAARRYNAAVGLMEEYEEIARSTVDSLQKKHAKQQEKLLHTHWQRKIKSAGTGQEERLSQTEVDDDVTKDGEPAPDSATTLADLWYWRQEQQTWTLLRRLAEFLFPQDWVDKEEETREKLSAIGTVDRFSPEEKVWARFYVEDDLARERHVVVTWLQECAEISGNDMDIIVKQLERAADGGEGLWAHGWLYTREAIKAQKRLRSWPRTLDPGSPGLAASHLNSDKTESLVTQQDPDAGTREQHVLEHQDQFYERSLWLACWQMLRRGKSWTEIREWFRDRAEGWRAASLRGAVPALLRYTDDDKALLESSNTGLTSLLDDGDPTRGSKNRALWRRMCLALARDGGLDDYERAVYGTLAGDVPTVEPVCSSWDDFLFVHYNALVLGQFDDYLREHHRDRVPAAITKKLPVFDAVQYHGEPATVGRRVVEQLKVHELTCREAHESMKLIQGALIAKDFDDFVYQQGLVLSHMANENGSSKIIPTLEDLGEGIPEGGYVALDDLDALRVVCHMLFIFADLGLDLGYGNRRLAAENIIVAYIDVLRLSGKVMMVPLYASRLSPRRQLHTLGLVLLDVAEPEMRQPLVRLMQGYKIDVPSVVKAQMQFIRDEAKMDEPIVDATPLSMLEETNSVIQIGRQIRHDFIGDIQLGKHEASIISSFEWYLYVGDWSDTFDAGTSLFIRFFLSKHLVAAQMLGHRMGTVQISLAKTEAMLGKAVDVMSHDFGADEEISLETAQLHLFGSVDEGEKERWRQLSSADQRRLLQQALMSKAKLYFELERLVWALTYLEEWRDAMDAKPPNVDPRKAPAWKKQLQKAYEGVVQSVEPLLHGWLIDVPEEHAQACSRIRAAYLPEVVLAYMSVLYCAGHLLSREILLQCMNLSTIVASPESDILPCFLESTDVGLGSSSGNAPASDMSRDQQQQQQQQQRSGGHRALMQELVTAFAKASRAILRAEEQGSKKSKGGGGGGDGGGGRGAGAGAEGTGAGKAAGAAAGAGGGGGGGGGGARKSTGKKPRRGRSENMGLWFVKA